MVNCPVRGTDRECCEPGAEKQEAVWSGRAWGLRGGGRRGQGYGCGLNLPSMVPAPPTFAVLLSPWLHWD